MWFLTFSKVVGLVSDARHSAAKEWISLLSRNLVSNSSMTSLIASNFSDSRTLDLTMYPKNIVSSSALDAGSSSPAYPSVTSGRDL
ncbi:hypothetical protein OGATHE_001134 [Ogataea polymorpha]|uniref:Uncharacterized protein n=1 Tax=Ogataea polymorpha TaxID=460523 RepID=A0A9P8PS32_9ASCO|nr:hypothetical protein OGATHE_001134 [Ogataea polymorpha]